MEVQVDAAVRTQVGSTDAVSGVGPAAALAAPAVNPSQIFVDRLFRADPGASTTAAPTGQNDAARAEVLRLWTSSYRDNGVLSSQDRTYIARVVVAQTGLGQPEAEKRVNDVIVEAKAAADRARTGAAKLSFWMTAALF